MGHIFDLFARASIACRGVFVKYHFKMNYIQNRARNENHTIYNAIRRHSIEWEKCALFAVFHSNSSFRMSHLCCYFPKIFFKIGQTFSSFFNWFCFSISFFSLLLIDSSTMIGLLIFRWKRYIRSVRSIVRFG